VQNGLKGIFSGTKRGHFMFVVNDLVLKGTGAEAVLRAPKVHEAV
jgi:hypothetical protein